MNHLQSFFSSRPAVTSQPIWQGVYWIAAAGLCLRIVFALAAANIHHPDELYQYLEQAHRLVFGYGYEPWEYRFGIRSWLLPFFISLPLFVCRFLHIDQPSIYIPMIKMMFCVLSTSVIFSAYTIARNLVSETSGRLAALFAAFWYELIYFSFRPLTEVVGAYFLLAGITCIVARPHRYTPYVAGFCLAMGCALRMLYLPLLPLILLPVFFTWERKQLLIAGAVFTAMAIMAGCIDTLTWGAWFVSYYNNYLFNKVYGVSSLFGTRGPYWLLQSLIIGSAGIFPVAFLCSFRWIRQLWLLTGLIIIIVSIHSLIPHKEYRHVFIAIPLLVMLTACVVTQLSNDRFCAFWLNAGGTALLLMVSWCGIANTLPYETTIYRHIPLYAKDPMLVAYVILGEKSDMTAIVTPSSPWWTTGGYYYLHHNVPVYSASDALPLNAYASYTIMQSALSCPSGFVRDALISNLQICRNLHPALPSGPQPPFDRRVMQPGIDDKYSPTVRSLF